MNPTDLTIKAALIHVVEFARNHIPTEPDHAIPHHRADERVRDLLNELIYETREQ